MAGTRQPGRTQLPLAWPMADHRRMALVVADCRKKLIGMVTEAVILIDMTGGMVTEGAAIWIIAYGRRVT